MSMRDTIDTVQKLFEMPYLFTTADDFGLSDPKKNASEYQRLLNAPHRELHEDENVLLAVTARPGLGEIFLLRKDTQTLTYYVKFKVRQIKGLGNTVSQVALWRRGAPGFERVTTHVFYNYLLEKYETIVSDAHQTEKGRDFWIDRMDEAITRGLTVGFIDHGKIIVYDGKVPFQEWLTNLDAWGDEEGVHENRLFFISKNKVG